METIIVGSRGSQLALRQTEWVINELKGFSQLGEFQFVVKRIKTKGDKLLDSPLSKIVAAEGDKGLFTKEIEEACLRKEIDFAVHSMKDLPTDIPKGLHIAAIPKREKAFDVLLTKDGKQFGQLPQGARIGTSSLRRKAQFLSLRPDLEIVELRGNLNTRIRKLREGLPSIPSGTAQPLDGIIVAYAGLKRMGYLEEFAKVLTFEVLTFLFPAVGQGAIGIEAREDDHRVRELAELVNDKESFLTVSGERAFLKGLGGGCQIPIGVRSNLVNSNLVLEGIVLSTDGKKSFQDKITGPFEGAVELGAKLAEKLLSAGAGELLSLQ